MITNSQIFAITGVDKGAQGGMAPDDRRVKKKVMKVGGGGGKSTPNNGIECARKCSRVHTRIYPKKSP